MPKRHGVAYLAFRTLEDTPARVIQEIGSEADYYLDHKLISHYEIDEVFPEDNKVVVAAYLELDIDQEQLDELVADLDYGFARLDSDGKEYRMELFDSSFEPTDL